VISANDEYILDTLQGVGKITYEQARQARELADAEGADILAALTKLGAASEPEVLKILANQFGMEVVDLRTIEIPQDVVDMVPGDIARRYEVVPVSEHEGTLTVAIANPLDMETLDSLRYVLKANVEAVVATRKDIRSAIDQHYSQGGNVQTMLTEFTQGSVDVTTSGLDIDEEITADTDAPIIKLVSLIILEAYRSRASDIHLEPMEKRFRVRYRVDGVLREVDSPPKRLQAAMITRVKIMANMKIAEKRVPQDGRIEINVMGKDLDLRVSTVPTTHGESVVMRILDKSSMMLGLPELGFFSDDQATFERLLALPDGILLVTGPTGSGKTTTLYACLNFLNQPDRKIITVEDPVEYQLPGINQVHVMSDIGLTFTAALRSILRQAPNIIMIGEIRDLETANIAINASLTGHLVFSTLHTNDAPSAITRLVDMGVKPFLVASSLRGIMAQRLVRRVCPHCRTEHQPTEAEIRLLGQAAAQMASTTLYQGQGCEECTNGYRGRRGIYEVLVVNDEVRDLVFQQVDSAVIRAKARALGMRTLREDGLRKAVAGITTIEEVLRVTMGDEA